MKVFEKFPFLLGLLASLFMLLSFMVKTPTSSFNGELAVMGLCCATVYWIWIVLQIRDHARRSQVKKPFWLVFAIVVPYIGSLLYQIMEERNMVEQQSAAQEPAKELAA